MRRLCLAFFLLIPTPALADHVPTQTPYDISIACDADGDTTKVTSLLHGKRVMALNQVHLNDMQ